MVYYVFILFCGASIVGCLVASILCLITSNQALRVAMEASVEVKAMAKSTHSIQFVPPDQAWADDNLDKKMKQGEAAFFENLTEDDTHGLDAIK